MFVKCARLLSDSCVGCGVCVKCARLLSDSCVGYGVC